MTSSSTLRDQRIPLLLLLPTLLLLSKFLDRLRLIRPRRPAGRLFFREEREEGADDDAGMEPDEDEPAPEPESDMI